MLKGISFHVRPGEKIALVGATGGGKTSTISALCRFYDIDRGAILVDGTDVREWDKQALRRHIGLVLQDVFLFSGDIGTNITLGDAQITEDQMLMAARRAHIAGFIERLPNGFREEFRKEARRYRRGSGNFCRSPAPLPSIPKFSSSTRQPARWIPRRNC